MKLERIDEFILERLVSTAARDIYTEGRLATRGFLGIGGDDHMEAAYDRGTQLLESIINYFNNKEKEKKTTKSKSKRK